MRSVALAMALALALVPAAAAETTLREALETLRRQGLPLVFSSSLVPADATVDEAPAATASPREAALQALRPHGLTLREAPFGFLLVVRDEATGSLRGIVVRDGEPAPVDAGVEVVLPATGARVRPGADGAYRFADLPAGRYRIEVHARGDRLLESEVEVRAGETAVVEFELPVLAHAADEIVVATAYTILGSHPGPGTGLTRQEILELPHFGDDLNRAVRALPATSGNEASARFNVRGGPYGEVLVSLDGLELYEPFHLKDLQGVFSILDPEVIDQVDLFPGGFPAEWGDRMTAVLDMRSRTPPSDQLNAGVSFSNAWLGGARVFAGGDCRWLGSARRGYLDWVLDLVAADDGDEPGETPDPSYWDAFSKLDCDLAPGSTLSLHALAAGDTVDFVDSDDPSDRFTLDTRWESRDLWLRHQQAVGARASFSTVASLSAIDRDRLASERAPAETFDLRDDRALDILGVRHDWSLAASSSHLLSAGGETRRYEADYEYRNAFDLPDPIDDPRFFPRAGFVVFDDDFAGRHTGFHLSDRFEYGRMTVVAGGRFDRQTWADDDDQWSPRLNAAIDLDRGRALRLGWGRFAQSQRPHELAVEFGDSRRFPAARATHWTAGFERPAGAGALRLDAYHRRVSDPHPRYETLFDPFVVFPEVAADRILIEADRLDASGLEIFYRARSGGRLSWWAHYALSEVEEHAGSARIARAIDQTHAFTANVVVRPGPKWTLDALWSFHTGWPTTSLSGEVTIGPDGRLEVIHHVGPFYAERLDAFHSLDLRASRATRVGGGELRLFVDVQNLYDRENARGRDLEDEQFLLTDGGLGVVFPEQSWFGIIPSLGLSWRR
jgi:hypothetical protein